MNAVTEFLSQYGYVIVYAALTAVAGFLGTQIKKIYEKCTNDDTKKKVVGTCVKAVEQLYSDLSGQQKLERAKENILAMLSFKGIDISELEMDMLIEATVAEFNLAFLAEAKKEKLEVKDNGISET